MAEAIVSWSGLRSRMADRPLSLAQEVSRVQTTEIAAPAVSTGCIGVMSDARSTALGASGFVRERHKVGDRRSRRHRS